MGKTYRVFPAVNKVLELVSKLVVHSSITFYLHTCVILALYCTNPDVVNHDLCRQEL